MLIDLIRSMRPRQWPKNAFVFVALLFDRKFFDPASVWPTVVAFVLLCLMSGAVYLMNDLAAVGRLMDENHAQLVEMTVSSADLDHLAGAARAAGALGAKLSGAGRGGNLIALVDESGEAAVCDLSLIHI